MVRGEGDLLAVLDCALHKTNHPSALLGRTCYLVLSRAGRTFPAPSGHDLLEADPSAS